MFLTDCLQSCDGKLESVINFVHSLSHCHLSRNQLIQARPANEDFRQAVCLTTQGNVVPMRRFGADWLMPARIAFDASKTVIEFQLLHRIEMCLYRSIARPVLKYKVLYFVLVTTKTQIGQPRTWKK